MPSSGHDFDYQTDATAFAPPVTVPQLPPEIIVEIIRASAPDWKGGWGYSHLNRCGKLYCLEELSEVSETWRAVAKLESMRYMSFEFPIEMGRRQNNDTRNAHLQLMMMKESIPGGVVKYADLVRKIRIKSLASMYEPEEESFSEAIQDVLQMCSNLNEVAIFEVDLESLRLLSQLKHLRSLHLQDFFLPLVEFGRPLLFLRHLSLDIPTHYRNEDHHTSFQFLSPLYLPNLESLNLHKIYLDAPNFLGAFLTCAPQLRYLFLAPLDDYPKSSNYQSPQNSTINILPSTLLSTCTSLRHLGLYHNFHGSHIPFNPFLENLPPSLRTLFLDPYEFYHLQQTNALSWHGLPLNLSNLQLIIVHPDEGIWIDADDQETIECWAHLVGVKWRLASEYTQSWIWEELHQSFFSWKSEITAAEVWNDLRETGQLK